MYYSCFSPPWFLGIDIFFQVIFALITSFISFHAWRIYRKSAQVSVKHFSFAFLSIALSYLTQAAFNALIFLGLNSSVCHEFLNHRLSFLSSVGAAIHVVLMMLGLLLLVYISLKVNRIRVFWTMFWISIVVLWISNNVVGTFSILSFLFFILIIWHFIENYLENRDQKTLIIAIAFLLIALGWLSFFLTSQSPSYYAIGHLLEAAGYVLILCNFMMIRNVKKTRTP